jgi:DNA-binding transcriptional ArsR family regulator
MAKGQGKRIPDTTRAAILAALLDGQAVTQVAEAFKLPHGTVSRLKKAIPAERLVEVERKKGEDIADLIAATLKASFEARQNILKQTENVKWLNEQSAAELATLYGVAADKEFRVLEAIENAQTTEHPTDWPEVVR